MRRNWVSRLRCCRVAFPTPLSSLITVESRWQLGGTACIIYICSIRRQRQSERGRQHSAIWQELRTDFNWAEKSQKSGIIKRISKAIWQTAENRAEAAAEPDTNQALIMQVDLRDKDTIYVCLCMSFNLWNVMLHKFAKNFAIPLAKLRI